VPKGHRLQPWVKIPSPSYLEKERRLKITIYGPYGDYEERLRNIAQRLRERYFFEDTYLVKDRPSHRPQNKDEDLDIFLTDKSYYYLRKSDVNLFIFYCGAYNSGVIVELKEVCDNIKWKLSCCAIFLDKNCNLGPLLNGQIKTSGILVDRFNGKAHNCDNLILQFAFARCNVFLKTKFDSLS